MNKPSLQEEDLCLNTIAGAIQFITKEAEPFRRGIAGTGGHSTDMGTWSYTGLHMKTSTTLNPFFERDATGFFVLLGLKRGSVERRLILSNLKETETPRDKVWANLGQNTWQRGSGFAPELTVERLVSHGFFHNSINGTERPVSRQEAERILAEGIPDTETLDMLKQIRLILEARLNPILKKPEPVAPHSRGRGYFK